MSHSKEDFKTKAVCEFCGESKFKNELVCYRETIQVCQNAYDCREIALQKAYESRVLPKSPRTTIQ